MTAEQRAHVLIGPLRVWAALMLLLGLTIAYAYWPALPLKTEAGLAVAIAKAALIAWLFMQLRQAAGIVRLAAAAGLVWATLLYLFTFSDLMTR